MFTLQIDLPPTILTAEILAFLGDFYQHAWMELRIVQVSEEEDDRFTSRLHSTATRIQIKSPSERVSILKRDIYHVLASGYEGGRWFKDSENPPIVTEWDLCREYGCFQPTAATQVETFKNGGILMDEHGTGESWHEIHEYCTAHLHYTNPAILSTIEVLDLAPGEKLWSRVVSWQDNGQFYAQAVWLVDEGDHESGENIVPYASPWLGPHPSHEAAIVAAQEYDEDEELERLGEVAEQAALRREDEKRDRWLRENS